MTEFTGEIDAVLLALDLGKISRDSMQSRDEWVPATHFKRCLPFGGAIDDAYPEGWGAFEDATPHDVDGHIDVSTVGVYPEQDTVVLRRVRSVMPQHVRGKVTRVARQMVEAAVMNIDTNTLKAWTTREHHGWVENRWVGFNQPMKQRLRMSADDGALFQEWHKNKMFSTEDIELMTGIQFSSELYWHVEIGLDNGLSVMLPTDPTALKDVFFNRDKVNGRRPSLRNWVATHWRQLRKNPELETRIRSHLRGHEVFNWDGYRVGILPSMDDLKRLQDIAQEPTPVRRLREGSPA